MDERVLPAVVGRDEPEALLVAEPLHDTSSHAPTALLCESSMREGGAAGTAFPHTTIAALGGPTAQVVPVRRARAQIKEVCRRPGCPGRRVTWSPAGLEAGSRTGPDRTSCRRCRRPWACRRRRCSSCRPCR